MNDDFQIRKDIDNLIEKYNSLNFNRMNADGMATEEYVNDLVDEKIKENVPQDSVSYSDLTERTEDYLEYSNEKYTLFRGDCFTINNNYESSAAITSTSRDNFTVSGTFRTSQDLVGVYWNSKDPITHPYISYGERYDYRDVVLECDVEWYDCQFDSVGQFTSTFTVQMNDGSIYYPITKDYLTDISHSVINSAHLKIDFNNIVIKEGGEYIDRNGKTVTVTSPLRLDASNIKFIMFVLIPHGYVAPDFNQQGIAYYEITSNSDFYCTFSNIEVTNAHITYEHKILEPHQYRLCEGYDDFYNLNPFRVCREMRKLGYVEWCDLYIGASHYYEKSGEIGDLIPVTTNPEDFGHTRTEKMVLDTSTPLNVAFSDWLDCYSRELLANECPNLVVSVSMENLQCPTDWRQKQCRPSPDEEVRRKNPEGYAMTGWTPSTFFYSPCHEDVLPYMQSVSEACLDIVVANGLPPILQLGEAWWWWNEYTDPTYKSPCFYDEATREKYEDEFGEPMEEYLTPYEDFNSDMIDWLNQQIVDYSWGIRSIVKDSKYTNGQYMALFFPPSVLDDDRVPEMMQRVNYLTGIYSPEQLDILQIEDYDWVTGNPTDPENIARDRSHHPEAYEIGESLGFSLAQQHYFGGFVQYPENAIEFWRLIKKAMDDAINLGFAETFVWAGSQVRRDKKILGHEEFELIQTLVGSNQTTGSNYVDNEEIVDPSVIPDTWTTFPKTEDWWDYQAQLKYLRVNQGVRLRGACYLHQNEEHASEKYVGRFPVGFRPSTDLYFDVTGYDEDRVAINGTAVIKSDGSLYVCNRNGTSDEIAYADEFYFDGIFFMV